MLKNRTRMAKVVVLCCIAALTAFVCIAQADEEGCGGEHGGQHRRPDFKKIEKKLGLTDAQQTQTKAIFQGNKEVVKPIITSLRIERKALQALIHADTVDEAAIRAQTAKVAGVLADLNVNRAKTGVQFRAILTPSQLATLKTLHQKGDRKRRPDTAPVE